MNGYITTIELLDYGLSAGYIRLAVSRKNYSWISVKDPNNKRKVLIQYDSIPLQTIVKYKMPLTYEEFCVSRKLQEIREKNQRELELQERLKVIKSGKEEMEQSYYYEPVLHLLEDGFKEHLHRYKTRLSFTHCKIDRIHEQAFKYAKIHVLYTFFVEKSGGVHNTGYGLYRKMFDFMQEYKKYHLIPESIRTYTQFSNKMRAIKEHLKTGYDLADFLIQETKFLKAGTKTDEFHEGILMYYACNPKHYATRVLADFVNHHAQENGKNIISESWVKAMLNNPNDNKFRVLIDAGRRGEKWTNDNIMPYLSRQDSMHPNNTWFIDGTPTQLFCKGSDGKQKRLYLFVVLDACTRRIIGFDIRQTGEDRFMVMNAIKMAIRYTGFIPYEIVSDNFSANKTVEIRRMQEELLNMGTKWRFAKVGNAQDKAQVERFNRTFQSMQQSMLEEYIGEGITSKLPNGRIDPEFIKEVAKKKGLIIADKMADYIVSLLCMYNAKKIAGRPSPNEKYNALAVDKAIKTDETNIPKIFWEKTVVTVKRGQITIQDDNMKYEYSLNDKHLYLSLQGLQVIVRYHKDHKGSVFIYDYRTDELIKEVKLKIKGYVSNAEVPEGQEDINYKFGAQKKSFKEFIKSETENIINAGLQTISETKETFTGVSAISLGKDCMNDIESQVFVGLYSETTRREFHSIDTYEEVATSGTPQNKKVNKILSATQLLKTE